MTVKRKRKGRVASKKNGYKSVADIYGEGFTQDDKFITFREMTKQWNEVTGENIKTNTMCVRYHNAMHRLAKLILNELHPSLTDEKIYEISRSAEFQVSIREFMQMMDEENDSGPGVY